MAEFKQGSVAVVYGDNLKIPAEAGMLSPKQVRELPKARRGIGLACTMTADAMRKHSDKLTVDAVEADGLAAAGAMAEDVDAIIAELEAAVTYFKQANNILDGEAHTALRRVLAHVRAKEKFDARIVDLVPHLIAYFANEPSQPTPGG